MTTELLSANHAAATAATLAGRANRRGRGFGGGVYPITPQTECIELLCKQEFEKGSVVRVESEHSAMAVCMGFAFGGARSFTASSSNGLAYMVENVFAAAMYRLPIVMMAVNRTLGPPWNIWVDHGDTLMLRDSGWLQFYCEDNQEVFDLLLAAWRIAEDPRVLLPVMVCQDAFVLSHTMMQTEIPSQAEVDRFLPLLELPHRLKNDAVTVGGLDFPHETEAHRRQHEEAMRRVPQVYEECRAEFQSVFGRRLPDAVVSYRTEDAELILLSMGTTASTVRRAVDLARARGIKAGGVRLSRLRPFPVDELRAALAGKQRIGVLDRDISLGLGGILGSEALVSMPAGALVQNYILGLGGGDIRPEHILARFEDLAARAHSGAPEIVEVA